MDVSTQNHERLVLALAAAAIGAWEWDVAGDRLVFLNVPDLPGMDPANAPTFEGFLERAAPEDREKVRLALRAVMNDPVRGDVFQVEFRVAGNEGRWLSTKGQVFRDETGKPARLTGVIMDVASRSRPGSPWHVGHKLRTPLSEIIGLGELLQETPLNEEQHEYLQTLLRSARRLVDLLAELSESISTASLTSGTKTGPAPQSNSPTAPLGRERPEAGTATPAGKSLAVLLVEDTAINQQVLTLLLHRAGHRVQLAHNGREALAALEREKFDLVLMDVQMPEMDGLRATRLIRAREKAVGGRVPVVAVTANAGQGERERCLAAGMDDYLSKPIRGADLFATIARLTGSAAEVRPDPAALSANWLEALQSMRLQPQAILRLVQTFLETTPERLEGLRKALASGDAAAVQAAAHSLKGSLAVFSARAAVAPARLLEEMGRQRRLADAPAALAELESEMAGLWAEMNAFLERAP